MASLKKGCLSGIFIALLCRCLKCLLKLHKLCLRRRKLLILPGICITRIPDGRESARRVEFVRENRKLWTSASSRGQSKWIIGSCLRGTRPRGSYDMMSELPAPASATSASPTAAAATISAGAVITALVVLTLGRTALPVLFFGVEIF